MSDFSGVIPVLQTPFTEDGSLDLPSLAAEVDYVIDAGCEAMAFPGFASEWWKLTGAEIFDCAALIAERARGRAALIGNVTAQSTVIAVTGAKRFVELGADALMCLPPFVVPPGPHALMAHLEAVLGAADIPQVLQYSASLTGFRMSPAEVAQLQSRHRNLRAVKVDFIPPGPLITALAEALPADSVRYLIGFAGLQMPDAQARGAHGVMGGAGHVREDHAVWTALCADAQQAGADAFAALLPLLNSEMQTIDMSIATHKWLLKQHGVFRSDHVRAPGAQLDPWQIQELAANRKRAQRLLPRP